MILYKLHPGFILIFLILAATGLPATCAQALPPRVAFVNLADTAAIHISGNRWYSDANAVDEFNYADYSANELTRMLSQSAMEVVEVPAPQWLNPNMLFSVFGQPSKGLLRMFEMLKQEYQADYVVLLTKKYEPDNPVAHRYLGNHQYGVGTYSAFPDVISVFSFVGFYLFDITAQKQISTSSRTDQYLLMDIRLERRMTNPQLKNLPQEQLDLMREKLTINANRHLIEIRRSLHEYSNQQQDAPGK
ncbi:MAG: hypothetical protein EOM83_08005 [Clostridia bacterium]|nr:hypothetical protein [Clostridia bacterium]